jgi:hypothetical protein
MPDLGMTKPGVIQPTRRRRLRLLVFLALGAGCDPFTDAATRLAYGIEAGAGRLGKALV